MPGSPITYLKVFRQISGGGQVSMPATAYSFATLSARRKSGRRPLSEHVVDHLCNGVALRHPAHASRIQSRRPLTISATCGRTDQA
ncbi:hypothetical protein Pden_1029 [Paracoccus denitrificans PD1222]|uniref:Uncharacterized protein n=1 Tax=Paracoccus denitrificans (strain Pd 1222) TaxID=318586 RepID=A1B0U6_PARDP|nr:hypothetical protein Pden_1029 [Paracoccus denitrificans PD1222]